MADEPWSDIDFDSSKAYVQQGVTFFDDGREIGLLHFIYRHRAIDEIRGSPSRILDVIDEYGRSQFLMNVGRYKGKIVTDLIAEVKPQVMVELGGYVGYSALLFGDAVRKAGGKRYYSLERNPEFAAVILSLVELAGLSDVVKVIVGNSADSLRRLSADGLKQIDLLFLDHWKPAYLSDLKLCEDLRLIRPGSVLAADNVIMPGNPPYLDYVRSSVQDKRNGLETKSDGDNFPAKTKDQYVQREGAENFADARGNPNLVYVSKLNKSYEPTGSADGVEVSRCVGEET